MNEGRLVFAQVMDLLDRKQLQRSLDRYPMARSSRSFTGRDQFLAMAFAQLTFRESLRDIEACLRGSRHRYAMGIRGEVTRTNLAYANEHRDWRVFADLAQVLIRKARGLYGLEDRELDLKEVVYALDSTTIDLCLSLFPWARFRATKAAIKVHTMIDLCGAIPVFIRVTDGLVQDVNMLDQIVPEPGSIYVFDRGYVDFARLHRLHRAGAYFVIRAKSNLSFYTAASLPREPGNDLRSDQIIRLKGARSKKAFPEKLRRIRIRDRERGTYLTFLTNHFTLPALTISDIYRNRWQIELFFKWIKQNLRIQRFFGTSDNAVKSQIWIAICVYLQVACLKKIHQIPESLGRILQVLSANAFQKDPIHQLLADFDTRDSILRDSNQLIFKDF